MFIGCLDHDKCYFPGAKKEEDCSTYVCTRDGTFKLSDPRKNDSKFTILWFNCLITGSHFLCRGIYRGASGICRFILLGTKSI